jgi:hypothetical protein
MIPDHPTTDQAEAAVAALAMPVYGEHYLRCCKCLDPHCHLADVVRVYSTLDGWVGYETDSYRYTVTGTFWEDGVAHGLYVFRP